MQWLNEPASWQRSGDVLRVSVDPGTDFWRTTGYGYVHDNGHVYGDLLPGDLDVSVRVRGAFASQYDQAGIMLRADEETWLKTGLEFFEGRPRLSTVLTAGWSSWMVADLPPGTDEVTLRVSRRGDAVEVRYAAGDGTAELAALVFMPPDREMLAGIVCAAPEGTGFTVAFHDLRIAGREWGGQGAVDDRDWAGESAAPAVDWPQEEEEEPAGARAGWAGDVASWADEQADDGTPGWAEDKPAEAASGWAEDKADDGVPSWAEDKADDGVPSWAEDKPAEAASGRAEDKPGEAASGRAEDKPAETLSGSAGVPAGWGDELPVEESLDWAKPQAIEPAEDWERLSLSVSASWNAFEAIEPAKGQTSQDSTSGLPEAAADDKTEPGLPAADLPPATVNPGGPPARGRNGRGRNKAKLPAPRPPVLPAPADPADEWISLLHAESAEEFSGPGGNRTGATRTRSDPDQE